MLEQMVGDCIESGKVRQHRALFPWLLGFRNLHACMVNLPTAQVLWKQVCDMLATLLGTPIPVLPVKDLRQTVWPLESSIKTNYMYFDINQASYSESLAHCQ